MDADSSITFADLEYHPVTPDRWSDLARLFGPRGACCGCWCMYWRLPRKDFDGLSSAQRAAGLKQLVDSGQVPGILAYAGDEPVAWCSIAPRETYAALARSRALARIDERPVWSIACFFVARKHRRHGLMEQLIRAAVRYAAGQGATIVEAYPTEPGGRGFAGSEGYMGSVATFARAGFREAARGSTGRAIMRCYLADPAA